jgi:hypothetical protein
MSQARVEDQKLSKTLGRHTKLGLTFSWTLGGVPVDLEADNYTVRVWVTAPDGVGVAGPKAATVDGAVARYLLDADDLADATTTASAGLVRIVAVAENTENTLVSDARAITVGDWGGADEYEPA